MALRNIRKDEDPVLRKRAREVAKADRKIAMLLDDMAETMYEAPGVGLAAPQVGILRRAIVYDIGEGLVKMLNPVITVREGEQIEVEGCLSVPGRYGRVKRPARVEVSYLDENGNEMTRSAEELEAVVICHETDHLDGILFTDKVEEYLTDEEISEMHSSGEADEEIL
ncbi:MAG TPA: peptide deformylase [Clostridia bacterium]|nr:peptide deformylase [Clostridia bacterium]HRX43392.1 peptide deformylase [Clostridia bacterium]